MLLANCKSGAMAIVNRLNDHEHPEAASLKAAVHQWKKSIGPLGRLCCRLGFYPRKPVSFDSPPGWV